MSKYEGAKFDENHYNSKQKKIVLITTNSKVGIKLLKWSKMFKIPLMYNIIFPVVSYVQESKGIFIILESFLSRQSFYLFGSVLVNDFWTPPLPINFVHDEISKLVFIYYYSGLG